MKGDRQAQKRLFKVSYPLSLSVCRRYSLDLEEAQSVVNEGMLKVFRELDQYSPDFPFGGWLRKIMVNSSIDHYRRGSSGWDCFQEAITGILFQHRDWSGKDPQTGARAGSKRFFISINEVQRMSIPFLEPLFCSSSIRYSSLKRNLFFGIG